MGKVLQFATKQAAYKEASSAECTHMYVRTLATVQCARTVPVVNGVQSALNVLNEMLGKLLNAFRFII